MARRIAIAFLEIIGSLYVLAGGLALTIGFSYFALLLAYVGIVFPLPLVWAIGECFVSADYFGCRSNYFSPILRTGSEATALTFDLGLIALALGILGILAALAIRKREKWGSKAWLGLVLLSIFTALWNLSSLWLYPKIIFDWSHSGSFNDINYIILISSLVGAPLYALAYVVAQRGGNKSNTSVDLS
jgi:hypothetical protein